MRRAGAGVGAGDNGDARGVGGTPGSCPAITRVNSLGPDETGAGGGGIAGGGAGGLAWGAPPASRSK